MTNPPKNVSRLADDDPIDYIKQYIDASAKSADRVRFVLLVMVTASILALVAVWNSRINGWPTSRLVVASNAQKFYGEDGQPIRGGEEEIRQKVWPKFFDEERYGRQQTPKRMAEYLRDREDAYKRAKAFVEASRFADLQHLKHHVDLLERARIERVLYITVPFFGFVMDINDLGTFAGITFIIILLLFRFSLLRELRNLRLAFMQAKTPEHLRLCYDMLAMQQVLTTPPEIEPGRPGWLPPSFGRWREVWWNTVSRGLYLIPFVVHLRIFYHDFITYRLVEPAFPGTVRGLWITGTLLVLNALLTGLCLYLGWKVDKSWRNHARWIMSHMSPRTDEADADDAAGESNSETGGGTKSGDAPEIADYGRPESGPRRVTGGSKHAYNVALVFAAIFVVSTATLLARGGGLLRPTSDATSWVVITVQILSALASISGAIHAWVKEKREAREQKLRIEKLEQELAAREKSALPAPHEKHG